MNARFLLTYVPTILFRQLSFGTKGTPHR